MDYVMELDGLSKSYGGKRVVDSFSLKMEKGHIYGLIGPNGAGKTTVMKMMAGLTGADAGNIRFFGSEDLDKMRALFSSIFDEPLIELNMTARQNMEYLRLLRGVPDKGRIDELLAFVGLENTGKKPAKQFSLGMRQRLGLAMSILPGPEIMVLDEPINGLDPEGIIEIRELILKLNREKKITVLISSHILDELAKLATHYGFINRGKIVREMSAEELEAACRKCMRISVSDTAALAGVLDEMDISYKIIDEMHADIFANPSITQLALALVEVNCEIFSVVQHDESLESFYISLIGGAGHE